MNGRGSVKVCPSTDTCPSLIASSRADCVRGRGPVDLVGQDDVGEDRPAMKDERPLLGVEDRAAQDVAGQQIGRELHAAEISRHAAGQGLGHQRFAHARHVLQQHVLARQHRDQAPADHLGFAQHDTPHIRLKLPDQPVQLLGRERFRRDVGGRKVHVASVSFLPIQQPEPNLVPLPCRPGLDWRLPEASLLPAISIADGTFPSYRHARQMSAGYLPSPGAGFAEQEGLEVATQPDRQVAPKPPSAMATG